MASLATPLPEPAQRDEWPGELLRPELAEIAAGLDARFMRGANLMAAAVATIRALLDGLHDVNAALDADGAAKAVGQLHGAAGRIAQLPDVMRRRDADLDEVSKLVREVEGHIADIGRQLQIIGIYGMNIKIAGAGGDFRIFVDDMAGRLKTGEAEIEVFSGRLLGVLKSVKPVRAAYAKVLSAQTGQTSEVYRKLDECGARLEKHLAGGAALARDLETLAGRVQDGVTGVLAAIQVADSTRQRIEHVVKVFDIIVEEAPVPTGARDHVARLLAALLESASADHARQSREVHDSLARLAVAGGDLAGLVDGRVEGDGGSPLRDLENGIAGISQMTVQLGDTATHAEEMVGCIADAADDLTRRLDSIDQIVRDVKEIAINTRLLCLRQGQTGIAVAVIAVEVAQQAIRLKETAAQVAAAIDRLAALNQGLRGGHDAAEDDLGQMLEEARAVIAQACQHSDSALAHGETGVRQLLIQLDEASAGLGDEIHLARTLDLAATALDRPAPALDAADEDWLRRTLPKIGTHYTMASERQIHARFLLPGMAAAMAAAAPSGPVATVEQDEDGLF